MKKIKAKYMSPYRATNVDQVCRLNRDNLNSEHGWILLESGTHVVLTQQTSGESPIASVTLPRAEFAKLARWFFTEQKVRAHRAGEKP